MIAASLVIGAVGAAVLKLPARAAASITAFGGGILFAAIALELVPDADEEAGKLLTAAGLVAGTLVYVGADAWLTRDEAAKAMRRSTQAAASGMKMPADAEQAARGKSIAAGLFVDGVPESVALGLTIAEGSLALPLLVGILVGNTVEAYGAAQPIVAGGRSKAYAIGLLSAIGLSLAVATVLGGTLLADASPALIGTAQAFAAGAVLAVIAISIIPYAYAKGSALVASATTAGFVAGYLLG